jgi:hypothetical protein
MTSRFWHPALAALFSLGLACGSSTVVDEDGSIVDTDGGGPTDGGGRDGGPPVGDGGPPVGDDGGPLDGGGPVESCDTPGAVETVACGNCGTSERFCTADGIWENGPCEGAGVCAPGTTRSGSCGNCGTQNERCTTACTWEVSGSCTGEGECVPGVSMVTGDGCPADQQQELTCSSACVFETTSACAAESCPTPGALETVACGMCGTQERFCTAGGSWSYGTCEGEGVCVPGTSTSIACGMCGTQPANCNTSCDWVAAGSCTGEGVCSPGERTRTSAGCPAGQTRLLECGPGCSYATVVEPCTDVRSVDVMLLFDITGSNGSRIGTNHPTFVDRLIRPLIALGDVAVGIAYYGDFPISPYGSTGDRPFQAGIQPTTTAASVEGELAAAPSGAGNDMPESGVEALSVLTGGTAPATAIPLVCSPGRTAGGCWRSGADRVVIVYTDAPNHNGPDPATTGLYSPYAGISPTPATWPAVATRLMDQNVELIVLSAGATSTAADLDDQADEMLTDLGQPAGNRIQATDGVIGTACDAAVARVQVVGGL